MILIYCPFQLASGESIVKAHVLGCLSWERQNLEYIVIGCLAPFVTQAPPLLHGAQTNLFGLANSAASPGGCSPDSSAAPRRGPRRSWCPGSASPVHVTTGQSRTGPPQRQHRGGAEIYHHHPNLQSHRRFAQTPEPLPGSASCSADYHCLEQRGGADTPEVMELFGASSRPCGLQGADH